MRIPAGALLFASASLLLAQLPGPAVLPFVSPEALRASAPGLSLPSWVFALVWCLIYPALGIAAWRVWSRRDRSGAVEALASCGIAFSIFLAFVPIASAAGDQRVTAMMDVLGTIAGFTTAWVFWRVDPQSVRWLAPLLLWMPITTTLKIVTL